MLNSWHCWFGFAHVVASMMRCLRSMLASERRGLFPSFEGKGASLVANLQFESPLLVHSEHRTDGQHDDDNSLCITKIKVHHKKMCHATHLSVPLLEQFFFSAWREATSRLSSSQSSSSHIALFTFVPSTYKGLLLAHMEQWQVPAFIDTYGTVAGYIAHSHLWNQWLTPIVNSFALFKFVIMMHDACAFQSLHCLLRCRGCLSQPPEDGSLESRNIAVKRWCSHAEIIAYCVNSRLLSVVA